MINLLRSTPPFLPEIHPILASTLSHIASSDLAAAFHEHRFGGTEADKAAAARWLTKRLEIPPDPERIIVTAGTQNALLMLIASLVGSNGVLLAEQTTYPQIASLAALLHVRVEPIAIDDQGMLPDAFEQACRQFNAKALYCIPTVHNPTASVLPLERRLAIADLARSFGVSVIEDDAQSLLTDTPPTPIASLAPDITWYVMTLSKCLSVGLRVGYMVAPSVIGVDTIMKFFRRMSMWFSAPISAAMSTQWIEDGTAEKILGAIRTEMKGRHEIVSGVLADRNYRTASNALFLWIEPPKESSLDEFVAAAASASVLIRSGREFALNTEISVAGARVSISNGSRDQLERGLIILGDLMDRR